MDFLSADAKKLDFSHLYNRLPIDNARKQSAVCKWLDICPSTLNRWLADDGKAPAAARIALWTECDYGRSAINCQLANGQAQWHALSQVLLQEKEQLTARIDRLAAELAEAKVAAAFACANDLFFEPSNPRPRNPSLRGAA